MSEEKRPNIIIIMANELGFGELGSFGQKQMLTPHLDELAQQGVRLMQHYCGGPMLAPSQGVLMTGKSKGHPFLRSTLASYQAAPSYQDRPLPNTQVTLGERLKEHGYATGIFGQWSLGGAGSTGDPTKRGFQRFYGYKTSMEATTGYPTHLWDDDQLVEVNPASATPVFAPDLINEQALAFIRENKSQPFFQFYPMVLPGAVGKHASSKPLENIPTQWMEAHDNSELGPYISRRTAIICAMDQYVGNILNTLEELDLASNTIVVFSSAKGPTVLDYYDSSESTTWYAYQDRISKLSPEATDSSTVFIPEGGTEVGEYDAAGLPTITAANHQVAHPYLDDLFLKRQYDPLLSTGPMRVSGMNELSHYEGNLRVPTIIRWPGHVLSGAWNSWLSGFEDWTPTLLELAGISDATTQQDYDSFSLAPMLMGVGPKSNPRPDLYREFATNEEDVISLRVDPYKLIISSQETNSPFLYNIPWELSEDQDLSDFMPGTLEAMQKQINYHLKR